MNGPPGTPPPPINEPMNTGVRLPAEILAYIIELSIVTSTPSPRRIDSSTLATSSPFSTPLRSSYSSSWSWVASLLCVSKVFFSITRPLLLRTLTLDSTRAGVAFFEAARQDEWLREVQRAWLGNLTALEREGVRLDPVGWRLEEAAWFEECSGGFVVGHAYASRLKTKRGKGIRKGEREERERERRYRSVSVYWAEEQLVEEVSDPERSSSGSDHSDASDIEEANQMAPTGSFASSSPALASASTLNSQDHDMGEPSSRRRSSHQESARSGDPRVDRPHEPAWQTLYSRQRRTSPVQSRSQASSAISGALSNTRINGSSQNGPSEGDLDPWDMQDAQERLAAMADATPQHGDPPIAGEDTTGSNSRVASEKPPSRTLDSAHHHRHREIYAYHICTATLEPFIQPLLSSIRTLRLITLTFYPGHLLDDDKLEHMLRRSLSPSESPRLETLLIRIVFDAASAGSRMRRFERTKTIAGAVDRIGDDRVRVMLVNGKVGEGELVESGGEMGQWSPVSRKAIGLTKEGWWSRVLQHNHDQHERQRNTQEQEEKTTLMVSSTDAMRRAEQERRLSDWSMFFPPSQHANPTHLVHLVHHCNPWPDCPNPV